MAKQLTFAAAMLDYFGKLPGSTSVDFMKEMKALSDDDKKWFRENLPKVGYEIVTL